MLATCFIALLLWITRNKRRKQHSELIGWSGQNYKNQKNVGKVAAIQNCWEKSSKFASISNLFENENVDCFGWKMRTFGMLVNEWNWKSMKSLLPPFMASQLRALPVGADRWRSAERRPHPGSASTKSGTSAWSSRTFRWSAAAPGKRNLF